MGSASRVVPMRFYLSSYKLGNGVAELRRMLPKNRRTAYIAGALDFSRDERRARKSNEEGMRQLASVGMEPEPLYLRDYFGPRARLGGALPVRRFVGARRQRLRPEARHGAQRIRQDVPQAAQEGHASSTLGKESNELSPHLAKLVQDGAIVRVDRGEYRLFHHLLGTYIKARTI